MKEWIILYYGGTWEKVEAVDMKAAYDNRTIWGQDVWHLIEAT